ncbi:MAG: transposase family protein [archaeon]|nr:transposase family protein [archaeon]
MDDTDREWYRRTLGLTRGWTVTDVQHLLVPLEVQVFVEYVGDLSCPVCGSPGRKYDFRRRSWQDLDHGSSRCIVYARVPRIECGACGVREMDVPWGGRFTRLSLRLEGRIFRDVQTGTLKDVADRHRVHEHTVRKILVAYSDLMMRELDSPGSGASGSTRPRPGKDTTTSPTR